MFRPLDSADAIAVHSWSGDPLVVEIHQLAYNFSAPNSALCRTFSSRRRKFFRARRVAQAANLRLCAARWSSAVGGSPVAGANRVTIANVSTGEPAPHAGRRRRAKW